MPDPKNRPYIEPTRSDSLDLVKKSQAVNDFYIGKGYLQGKDRVIDDPQQAFKELDDKYRDFSKRYDDGVTTYNTSGGSTISNVYEPRFYRENDTGNTFSQRETYDGLINFEAPMSGYNRSIAPHSKTTYSKKQGMVGEDFVSIPSYNILATTPADLLKDEQIVKRVEQFGSTGIPNSRLRKLGLPLNEDAPSAFSLKRKKDREIIDQQLKEAGLYNRAEGITGRNPDASRMYEEYIKSKQQDKMPTDPPKKSDDGTIHVTDPNDPDYLKYLAHNKLYRKLKDNLRAEQAEDAEDNLKEAKDWLDLVKNDWGETYDDLTDREKEYYNKYQKVIAEKGIDKDYFSYSKFDVDKYRKQHGDAYLSDEDESYLEQAKALGLDINFAGTTDSQFRSPIVPRPKQKYILDKATTHSVPQVPNQVQSAGEVIKQPIEERIPEGYQLNLGYRGADGRYYGNTYNPTTSEGETYPVPGAPTIEDYKKSRAAEINPERTGTRFVSAKFAAGGRPTDPPYIPATRQDSLDVRNASIDFGNTLLNEGYEKEVDSKGLDIAGLNWKDGKITPDGYESLNKKTVGGKDIYELDPTTDLMGSAYIDMSKDPNRHLNGYKPLQIGPGFNFLEQTSDYGYQASELAAPYGYNTNLPTFSLDSRIAPQGTSIYERNKKGYDVASFPYYDPLAVTPWADLSKEDKVLRREKYGNTGTPFDTGTTKKPRSESSLAREKVRDTLQAEMDASGFKGKAREVLKKGSEAEKAYQKHIRNYTKKEETPKETVTPKKDKVELPKGYSYRQDDTRDGDINDYFKGNKRMKREDWIKATGYSPTKFRERTVRAQFAAGGVPPTDPPPIKVQRADDPRLHSYMDSLNLYKGYQKQLQLDPEQPVPKKWGEDFQPSFDYWDNIQTGAHDAYMFKNNKLVDEDYYRSKHYYSDKEIQNLKDIPKKGWENYKAQAVDKPTWNTMVEAEKKRLKESGGSQKEIDYIEDQRKLSSYYDNLNFRGPTTTGYYKSSDLAHKDIKPVKHWRGSAWNPEYKKPVQPYEYEGDTAEVLKHRYKTGIEGGDEFGTRKASSEKPRSESSLKREEARNILKKEMDTLGFTGYTPRQVSKKGSEAEKAYQKHIENYTKTTAVETPKVVETPTKPKVTLPKGYSYTQHQDRDGDMNDYFFTNKNGSKKRISREDFIKNTNYSPVQYRERTVKIPKFRDGGPINNDGPLAKPQGDIYLPLDGTRPSYTDASGKERSEYKIGVGTKNGEMVIPTVWNGEQHTEDEAIERYYNTGEHMGGPYGSIEEGERAAKLRTFLYNEHPAYSKKAYGGPVKTQDVTTNEYGNLEGFKDVQKQNIFGRDIHKRIEYDNYGGAGGSKTVTKEKGPKGRSNKSTYEVETTGPSQYNRESGYSKTMPSGKQIQVSKEQGGGSRLVDKRSYDPATEILDIKTRGYIGPNPFAVYKRDLTQEYAYGGCAPKYAQGGQLYEAEGGEVIDGGNPITLQGGHISPNSSNSGKIVGNSHGNGGVKMTGGEKIYSDRLTVDSSFLKDLDI